MLLPNFMHFTYNYPKDNPLAVPICLTCADLPGWIPTLKAQSSVTTRSGMTGKLRKLNPQGRFQGLVPNRVFVFFSLMKAFQIVQVSTPQNLDLPMVMALTLGELSLWASIKPVLFLARRAPYRQRLPFSGRALGDTRSSPSYPTLNWTLSQKGRRKSGLGPANQ